MFAKSKVADGTETPFSEIFREFIQSSLNKPLYGPSFDYGIHTVVVRYVSESCSVLDFRCYFNTNDGSTSNWYHICINTVSGSSKFIGTFDELVENREYFRSIMTTTGIPMHIDPMHIDPLQTTPVVITEKTGNVATDNDFVIIPNVIPEDIPNAIPEDKREVILDNHSALKKAVICQNPVAKEAVSLLRIWMEEQSVGSIAFNGEPGFCSFEVDGFNIGVELRCINEITTFTVSYESQTYQFTKDEISALEPELYTVFQKFIDFDTYALK